MRIRKRTVTRLKRNWWPSYLPPTLEIPPEAQPEQDDLADEYAETYHSAEGECPAQ